jgi:hypothetical protein
MSSSNESPVTNNHLGRQGSTYMYISYSSRTTCQIFKGNRFFVNILLYEGNILLFFSIRSLNIFWYICIVVIRNTDILIHSRRGKITYLFLTVKCVSIIEGLTNLTLIHVRFITLSFYCKLLRFLTVRQFYDCIRFCKRKAVLLVKDISTDIELKRALSFVICHLPLKEKDKIFHLLNWTIKMVGNAVHLKNTGS